MSSKKILNFVLDEKFTDAIIMTHDLFEEYEHEYIFVNSSGNHNFKLVKYYKRIHIIKINDLQNLFKRTDIGGLFLHSLYSYPIKLITKIPPAIKIFWFSWGYDIYERPIGNPLIKLSLYRTLTEKELRRNQYLPLKIKKYTSKYIKKLLLNGFSEKKTYLKAINRIDYYSGVLPEEYAMVKDATDFKACKITYKYLYPNSSEFLKKIQYNGNNIFIGNSANPTNNHIDILHKLKGFNLGGRKLVVPLSYGGNKQYIHSVTNYGRQYFGDNWHSLKKLMEYEKYQEIISSCNVGIFLIERQQGMGNIYMLLRRGCKLFLSETSVIFKYLISIGVKVFSFENELTQESLDSPLTEEEKERNRNIIMESSTLEAAKKRFSDLYKLI